MTKIAAVKMQNDTKALWFDANGIEASIGDKIIVETSRGIEIGVLDSEIFDASDEEIKQLNSELKSVKRVANKEDLAQEDEMKHLSDKAFPKFKKIASETNEQMNPISVEYLFDGKKAVFYFSAPERQDFRDLIKKLSNEFHIRVDMRQINEREKSSMISGFGICGQELCCARLGKCPKHVSIKMAKTQGMSLNPENISGMCGKLLCCLDYEYEAYKEFCDKTPKLKAKILTPDGTASVVDINMPKETIEVKLDDSEKRVKVALSQMETSTKFAKENGNNSENIKPNKIGKKAWNDAQLEIASVGLESVYTSTVLQGSEKLATGVVKNLPSKLKKVTETHINKKNKTTHTNKLKRRTRNVSKVNRSNKSNSNAYESKNSTTMRRRSRTIGSGSVRPGQHSSGVKH